jgi:trehalose-6-phosphatase
MHEKGGPFFASWHWHATYVNAWWGSGRAQVKLEETFGELEVWLAAENGIYMRPPGAGWITLLEARAGAPPFAADAPSA